MPRDYAPTWSWASVRARIVFARQRPVDWEIREVISKLATANPYGPVLGARLTVAGLLLPASIMWTEPDTSLTFDNDTLTFENASFFVDVVWPSEEVRPRKVFVTISRDRAAWTTSWGLVLEQIHTGGTVVYKRIGFLQLEKLGGSSQFDLKSWWDKQKLQDFTLV
jgi:hypothetical protein